MTTTKFLLKQKRKYSNNKTAATHDSQNIEKPVGQSNPKLARKLNKLIETTYRNNADSDYTEKIAALTRSFRYTDHKDNLWSDASHSLLYGTPLYEQASTAQRLALNHLSWFANYNYISNSETETVMYNQVTGSVFKSVGGYDTLAAELAFETEQEYDHIKAFRKVGLMTATSLIGRTGLNALLKWNSYKLTLGKRSLPTYQYYALRTLAKTVGGNSHQARYSGYLHAVEEENPFILKAPTTGMLGRSVGPSLPWQSFYGFSWGVGSPFMACHFYTVRMIANLYLKNMEHAIAKYAKQLENNGSPIPAPTAISRYHFLDEAFHTTISKLLAKDLYREFPKPTTYEKLVANSVIYKMQTGTLGGLSAVLPHRYFADDFTLLELLFQLFQSPVFGFSKTEAKHWLERCFCEEHEGLHVAATNRKRLLKELKTFFADVDYLWPVNREMGAMAARGELSAALRQNRRTFGQFWESAQDRVCPNPLKDVVHTT
ncbi:MAG: hypothetical protein AAFR58_04945 [Cyanobacteria bacterium J06627_28]